jgi:hypothetical protein
VVVADKRKRRMAVEAPDEPAKKGKTNVMALYLSLVYVEEVLEEQLKQTDG